MVEVDLGYTDPIKKDTKAQVVTKEGVKSGDDLVEHSEKVQNRINQLTRKMREAERREKAALDYAKGLQMKYSKVEKDLQKTDKSFVKEYENRVDAETDKVKTQILKMLCKIKTTDKMMEANQNLTRLAVEKEKARMKKQRREAVIKTTTTRRTTNTTSTTSCLVQGLKSGLITILGLEKIK